MTLEELRSRHRRFVELAQRRGAHKIRVFGSVARGDQRLDSDVDFLVDFGPGRSSSLLSCGTPSHYEG